MRRDLHFGRHFDLARFQPLEQQIERHDLCQRGGVARTVGIGRLQYGAGIGVHDDRGIGRLVAFGGGGAMMAVVPSAGIGSGGDGGKGQQRPQAENAPTEMALDNGSRTQHPLSPTPLLGGLETRQIWPIYSGDEPSQ